MDIVIEGNRITSVEKRRKRAEEEGTTLVDATGLTVMPGLIDAHNHWHLRGREWGSRQGPLWLAYGVTTTRSPATRSTRCWRPGRRWTPARSPGRATWPPGRRWTAPGSTTTSCAPPTTPTEWSGSWSAPSSSTTT
ncbi:hypothetical protein ACFQXA_10445 [Nocardiopsis composta]